MITRNELADYLDSLLQCNQFKDYAPNGLQIEGKEKIGRLCTAVTASLESILQAVAWQADALLVHHGYFWRGENPEIIGIKKQRISKIIDHQINLFAYHLPLDCHPEYGNNFCLTQLLQLNSIQMHQAGGVKNLLWSGKLPKKMTTNQFTDYLTEHLGQKPLHVTSHNKEIESIALCSGAAQDYIEDAHKLGVDAYLSGEISERTYYQAQELGIHYFACGHHATERYGIQALGSLLETTFGLEHLFVDSNNPV